MLFIALIIYAIFNLLPKWVLRDKYNRLEENYSLMLPFLKLSAFVFSFFVAFLLILGVVISDEDKFIKNKNAIYGFEFNEVMKKLGFEDGMKIKSINGEPIERVSDIFKTILIEIGEVELVVEKNEIIDKIVVRETDKIALMSSSEENPVKPILFDSNGKNGIKLTIKKDGFPEAIRRFGVMWKHAFNIINPNYPLTNEFSVLGISKESDYRVYLIALSFNLIFLVIINILPFPGFSIGNFITSVIETSREKLYEKKKKRIIGWSSILIVSVIIIIIIL